MSLIFLVLFTASLIILWFGCFYCDVSRHAEKKLAILLIILLCAGIIISIYNIISPIGCDTKVKKQKPEIIYKTIYEKVKMTQEERKMLLQACIDTSQKHMGNSVIQERMQFLRCDKVL